MEEFSLLMTCEGFEFRRAGRGLNCELVILAMVNHACFNELRHETRRHLARLIVLLQGHDLLLKLVDHSQLGFNICLLLRLGIFVSLDLLEGPSSLG